MKISEKFIFNKSKDDKKQVDVENLGQFTRDFDETLQVIEEIYTDCMDFVVHEFYIADARAVLVYFDNMIDKREIDENILSPLLKEKKRENLRCETIIKRVTSTTKGKSISTFAEAVQSISLGSVVLLIEGNEAGIVFGVPHSQQRSIESPEAENVLRGPREGFVENIHTNITLIRKRLRSPRLKFKKLQLGVYTETTVAISYIEGIAEKSLVEEVESRLNRIDVDGVLNSGYVEEFIEDSPFSPFPQLISTERPDVVTADLLEGRVVILIDGTPFCLVAPVTIFSLLQSMDDYTNRFILGTLIRWLRYGLFVISLTLPSIYVAILTFHQEMVPTTLLISVAATREQIPFPALVEALIMEVVFEALREAGLRLPKQIGAAVSIVGALVIGEAAVSAGLVSPPMVIVVALTGIASFSIPRYALGVSMRFLRFPLIILAGTLGLLGVMLGVISLIIHLASLRSFGVPYLSPLGPLQLQELKDTLLRAPIWSLDKRPHLTGGTNERRQSPGQKPGLRNKRD
ncbi:spore germination protein [Bacillus tianshenii]|nr:spore germination protein [Bacillus tianshenii]